jgi:hypothetical protein
MKFLAVLLAIAVSVLAAQKVETVKVIKADTIVTIRVDTIRTVKYDTLYVRKTFNDTSILIKQDTVKAPAKTETKKK